LSFRGGEHAADDSDVPEDMSDVLVVLTSPIAKTTNTLTILVELSIKKTYQFTPRCNSDQVTISKQHKSFY